MFRPELCYFLVNRLQSEAKTENQAWGIGPTLASILERNVKWLLILSQLCEEARLDADIWTQYFDHSVGIPTLLWLRVHKKMKNQHIKCQNKLGKIKSSIITMKCTQKSMYIRVQ